MYAKVADKVPDRVADRVSDRVSDKITDNQHKILVLLSDDNHLSLSNLAQVIGISKRNTLDNVNVLREKGFLQRVGTPKDGYWKVIYKKIK